MVERRYTVMIIGLIAIILGLASCREAASPTSTPVPPTATPTPVSPTATPRPTATPTPPSAAAILQAAFDATQQASSYRFDMDMGMTLSGPDIGAEVEIAVRFTGDVVPPDSMQGTMTMTVNDAEVETQVVVIGQESYVLNPLTNEWQANPQTTTMFAPKDWWLTRKTSRISNCSERRLLRACRCTI